ncbi:MAG: hypothetical protein ACM65L_11465 [Microcoleus sp.]
MVSYSTLIGVMTLVAAHVTAVAVVVDVYEMHHILKLENMT